MSALALVIALGHGCYSRPQRMSSAAGPSAQIPFPPLELAHRVGSLSGFVHPFAVYEGIGRHGSESIRALLPKNWSFQGKRVLDFGCGAGRTLRHFFAE